MIGNDIPWEYDTTMGTTFSVDSGFASFDPHNSRVRLNKQSE